MLDAWPWTNGLIGSTTGSARSPLLPRASKTTPFSWVAWRGFAIAVRTAIAPQWPRKRSSSAACDRGVPSRLFTVR